jgi:hypothetical protein
MEAESCMITKTLMFQGEPMELWMYSFLINLARAIELGRPKVQWTQR